jgi:MFS family permease
MYRAVHSCTHWLRHRNPFPPFPIGTRIRGRYWLAKIDDISLLTPLGNSIMCIIRCLKDGPTRRALAIGCGLQVFQQATGINTLMYYTATIVSMAGIGTTSASSAIWTSAVITAAYLAACCAGVLLVERLGRRRLLLTSLLGVVFSLVLIAAGFQLASSHSPAAAASNSSSSSSSCDSLTTCSACLEGDGCGFCSSGIDLSVPTTHFLLLMRSDETDTFLQRPVQ